MTASIVQSASSGWFSVYGTPIHLPSPVTAGNLLVACVGTGNYFGADDPWNIAPNVGGSPRPFTPWSPRYVSDGGAPCRLGLGYRIATGDEQTMNLIGYAGRHQITLYEITNAGDPATFEVVSVDAHSAESSKSLAAFTVPGDLQIMGFVIAEGVSDQTVGTGWTQDFQAFNAGGAGNPNMVVAHASTGPTASMSGGSHTFGGMAVGITSGAAFAAAFSGTPRTGVADLDVAFTDESAGTPTAWSWDFGDGGTSTSQNPSHTYTAAGTYTVTLEVTKTGGDSTLVKTGYIVVGPAPAAGVYLDWDGDGFGTGDHDDVSSDVIGWTINRGYGPEITGQATPGSCVLTLKNPDNLYNPANASGPLYGKLHDGVPIWIGVNSDGLLSGSDPRGLFGGRITDIAVMAVGGASAAPTVEITCEDFLGWAARRPVYLDTEGLSQAAFRQAALDYVGGAAYSLAHEIQTIPVATASTDLGSVLASINAVNGTRHFVKAADNFTDWWTYVTRNRFWRLDGTVDLTLDASSDHVTGTDGWRLSSDTVTNEQKATVVPISFTPNTYTVWQQDVLPFGVTADKPFTRWVTFDDVVRDGILNLASTGATITSAITLFGTTAYISLTVASGTATVSALSVEGRLVRRLPAVSYVADDATSQSAFRGVRAGSEISGEYLGVIAEAKGIADHVVYRYAEPQFRPTATLENKFPEMFEADLFDIASFTSSQLAESGRLFEIVGLTHRSDIAATGAVHHSVDYVLQESRVQSDPGWFLLDDAGSLLDAAAVLAY